MWPKGGLWSTFCAHETRINVDSLSATQDVGRAVTLALAAGTSSNCGVVVVCIGSDRSTGDSLGPIIGTLLSQRRLPNTHIYGTLRDPVHAVNLHETAALLSRTHAAAKVVAVDACLGKSESIGLITVGRGSLRPGAGVNKDLPPIGDIYVTGVVNVGGYMEYFVLQNTRLYLVYRLAETIAAGLSQALLATDCDRIRA
ncbi:MAG: spore protease YyaC [Firmicutes bacterium]|nr:spore protease YyaC [Dethiobacter sp.]MBS3888851.1 spore protease YyaC [Bacillota bacterium]MBS4054944.1 spore protease YyaC [Thermaerobacter sp.]